MATYKNRLLHALKTMNLVNHYFCRILWSRKIIWEPKITSKRLFQDFQSRGL